MKKIVSVFDSAAEIYSVPYFEHSADSAFRNFKLATENVDSTMHHHPQFYTLFDLGTYDERTGRFDLKTPEVIARAWELKSSDVSVPSVKKVRARSAKKFAGKKMTGKSK